jgi:Protein of unknown function (DUF1592)/Protein of unknown function (DUF1588)/Protein of unknown function (DUF1587)/Protein of unknown function (DUF1595)/Protein of unknown function (DUF1585)
MRDVAGGFGKAELYLSIAALLGTLSCTGVVGGEMPTGSDTGIGTPGPGTGVTGTPTKPGRGEMHRLNATEYNATVGDVLGTTLKPANANWRGGEIEGFDNVASVLGIDDTQFGLYVDAAEQLANDVFANAPLKAKFVTCAKADDAACTSDIISKAGLHIFRRPLRPAEVSTYQKVYTAARKQGQDHDGSVKAVLWSLLSSAEFLYRIELPKGTAKRALDGFELASRLSYFLWSSAPDDALLDAASKNALSKDTDVQAAVDRMLGDVKSTRFTESFAGQWLGARKVASHAVAPERFPMWTPVVANAAMNEMYMYFEEFLRKDRPWTEFLKADINFVNTASAPLYGMTSTSMNLVPVMNTTDNRAGFMGLAGFLTLSSMDRRTSPTLRGKWVLGNLLCQEAPPPPKDVPKLDVGGKDLDNGNVRDILTAHRVRPDCAGCHAIFDPFGLALENFDAVGRFRDKYGDGSAIDATATLNGVPFQGISGAADAVTNDPAFKTCFAHKLFTYGLGRSPAGDDAAWVAQIEKQWEQGDLTIKRLISGVAGSVPFRNSGDVK